MINDKNMEKIDLTKLLKDCPKGTKFYSPVYGKIEFIRIETFENNPDPITIKWFKDENTSFLEYLRADGTFRGLGECIIFPSEKQRNWSKWQRPFVDGDFVVQGEYSQIFILKEINDVNKSDYRGKCYIGYDYENCEIYPKGDWWFDKHATEEEKQRLIDTLKENGYEWDAEKKELKTLQPFKDGDIIYNSIQKRICICHYRNDETLCISHCRYNVYHKEFELLDKDLVIIKQDYRIATDEEKQILFDSIKENGYKWNPETKTLEKLIVPKFKVGDIVQSKTDNNDKFTITDIDNNKFYYGCGNGHEFMIPVVKQDNWELVPDKIEPKFKVGDMIRSKNGLETYKVTYITSKYYSVGIRTQEYMRTGVLPIKEQDDWLLIPNKFDPKTLEHFDKVLVRYDDDMPWCIDFFSYYDDKMRAVCTGEVYYDHCIPYNEDTKHLVGKLKDAPEFYKYWEAR